MTVNNELERIWEVFLSKLVNTATSSPADDVHHYVIPQSYYPVTTDQ
jgi:hypothetical protein